MASSSVGAGARVNANSALAVVLTVDDDCDLYERVEAIRARHQKGYGRWPPHINLMWPFVHDAELEMRMGEVQEALDEIEAFEMRLPDIAVSEPKTADKRDKKASRKAAAATNLYTHLRPVCDPPNALLNVHAALSAIFPQCAKRMDDSGEVSDEPFSPHLTVGQCTREEAAEISRNWTGGSMIVSAIHVLSRSDINATFKIRHTFYLREREPRE